MTAEIQSKIYLFFESNKKSTFLAVSVVLSVMMFE